MKIETIQKYLKVLLAGVLHALKGALAIAALAAAGVLFYCVATDTGYFAVVEFLAALLCVRLSLLLFYRCGRDLKKVKFSF